MILIDTSILVDVWRDKSGLNAALLLAVVGEEDIAVTRAIEMELLAGARDDIEWLALVGFLDRKVMVEMRPETWRSGARLYFDLRRAGFTIRKLFDCCIAQVAIENNLLLIHDDRDFETIAVHHPLKQNRLDFKAPNP
jgi:predicted nucleic acid-binding protein